MKIHHASSLPAGRHPTLKIYSELVELNKLFTDETGYKCKHLSRMFSFLRFGELDEAD